MCINIQHREPKIAKKDIVCWKYLRPTYEKELACSVIYSHIWKVYETYEINLNRKGLQVFDGFHAYLNKEAKFTYYRTMRHVPTATSTTAYAIGFNASYTLEKIETSMNAKMVIPKGSLYYLGENSSIVSNQMKLVEIL